jgi:hypothetical protein
MIDSRSARIRTHRRNIQRYGRLLATELTDLERQYLHRRIVEEQVELSAWHGRMASRRSRPRAPISLTASPRLGPPRNCPPAPLCPK